MFEAQGINQINGLVSTSIPSSPRQLALQIKSKKVPGQKLFIVIEKNRQGSCTLFYRKKFYEEASIVADHLLAYFLHLYGEGVLLLFDPYYQDLAKDAKWIEEQPYYEEELELNEAINDDVDLKWIIEEKLAAKKRVRIYKEDNVTMASYKTIDYINNSQQESNSQDGMESDQLYVSSAWGSEKPLVPY